MITELSRIQAGDVSIGFRREGHGPPLVLLHGFLCDSRCWRCQLEDLSQDFDVIAWDAPGAGSSPDPTQPFAFADWSRCLAQFMDALAVERVHIVGLSWGGVLAQDFYKRYPTRVSRLILAGTYAGWKGSFPASAVEQRMRRVERDSQLPGREFASRWVAEMFSAEAPQGLLEEMAAIFADFHPKGFRQMAKSLADTDTTEILASLPSRTLLLWGEQDARSPIPIAEQIRKTIPRADLHLIAGAGHVCNMEQPVAFNAAVRRFCLTD